MRAATVVVLVVALVTLTRAENSSRADVMAALIDTGGLRAIGSTDFYNCVVYRESAVLALAVRSLDSVAEHLGADSLDATLTNPSAPERSGAGVVLSRIRDTKAHQALVGFLTSKDSSNVQVRVLSSAGAIGDSIVIELLFDALGSEVALVRATALERLSKLNRPGHRRLSAAGSSDLSADIMSAAVRALKDDDYSVRMWAIRILAAKPDSATIGMLESALTNANKDVVVQALRILADIDDTRAIAVFERSLLHAPPYVRYRAMETAPLAASFRRHRMDMRMMVKLMLSDHDACEIVGRRLRGLGDTTITPLVTALLKSPDDNVRMEALEILGRTRDARSVPAIATTLRDGNPEIRTGAAWALGGIGGTRAKSLLLAALKDSAAGVRLWAAQGLGTTVDTNAVEPLVGLLRSGDAGVAKAAAWALGSIRDRRAIPQLTLSVRTREAIAARQSAVALARFSGDGVDSLVSLLGNGADSVRRRAAAVLAELHDSTSAKALAQAADRQDLQVVAEDYGYYIKSDPVGYRQVLLEALRQHGTWMMAEAMIASKDPELASAARRWYDLTHNYGPTCGGVHGYHRFDWHVNVYEWNPATRLNTQF